MSRRGHSKPAGSVWRMRMHDMSREPDLGDLWFEEPEILVRGFRCVGVEETSKSSVWALHLERMTWGDFMDAAEAEPDRVSSFVRRHR